MPGVNSWIGRFQLQFDLWLLLLFCLIRGFLEINSMLLSRRIENLICFHSKMTKSCVVFFCHFNFQYIPPDNFISIIKARFSICGPLKKYLASHFDWSFSTNTTFETKKSHVILPQNFFMDHLMIFTDH